MPLPAKLNQVIGFLAKEEATYGTAETLSDSADGLNPYIGDSDPEAPTEVSYVYDGMIGNSAANLAPQRRTTPNGKFRTGQFQALPKGAGEAYTALITPPREIHRMLKASGFTATVDTTADSESWTYAPTTGNPTSVTLRQYAQGSQYDQTGVLCDFSYETQGLGVPVFTFDWSGIAVAPTDVSLPAITLTATGVLPIVSSAVVGVFGTFTTATIRRVAYRRNRNKDTARLAMNLAGGHAGFVAGRVAPEFEIEVEMPARSTYDWDAVVAAATSDDVSVTFGTTQYNRFTHSFPQAQLKSAVPGSDGPLATLTLTYSAYGTTASDYEVLTFD